jgi:hypothetical protein
LRTTKENKIKRKLLLSSAGCVVFAILSSVSTSLFVSDPELALRITGVNTTLIIGSIGLFFVGLVFPEY